MCKFLLSKVESVKALDSAELLSHGIDKRLFSFVGRLRRVLRRRWREHREGQQLSDQQQPQLEEKQVPSDVHGWGAEPDGR